MICNVKYTMPQRYVGHRWLSVYDVTLDAMRLLDCLTLFYFPWISESLSERAKYLPVTAEIIQSPQETDCMKSECFLFQLVSIQLTHEIGTVEKKPH